MIIQTGMRTDIPAFYSEWFANRVKAGYVMVRNPYNPINITKYSLSKDVVDVICFCTKNPGPMLQYMKLLEGYGQYWFVTITPYGKDVEPNVPDKYKIIDNFKKLSEIVGINSMGWRYDPILITKKYSIDYHLRAFEKIAGLLSGYTKVCIISFIDLYEKVKRNFSEVKEVSREDMITLTREIVKIARKYDITLKTCCEGDFLKESGADCSGCMTLETYEKAIDKRLVLPKKKPARNECACFLSGDIGAYNTCGHMCRYCYANYSKDVVLHNMKMHDKESPLLLGEVMSGDKIHVAEQKSWIDSQLSLFDIR